MDNSVVVAGKDSVRTDCFPSREALREPRVEMPIWRLEALATAVAVAARQELLQLSRVPRLDWQSIVLRPSVVELGCDGRAEVVMGYRLSASLLP